MKWSWLIKEEIKTYPFGNYRYCASCEKFCPEARTICPECGEYTTNVIAALIYRRTYIDLLFFCWETEFKLVGLKEKVTGGFRNYIEEDLIGFE